MVIPKPPTMTDVQCQVIANNVKRHGVASLVSDDAAAIWRSFHAAEACRRIGDFEVSSRIISEICKCSFATAQNVRDAIQRHEQKIATKDVSPLVNDQISFFVITESTNTIIRPVQKCPDPPPPLLIRGWNFAFAMARWAGSGFEMRTQDEINERLAICQACPHLVNDHCNLCGCACVEKNQAMNKLALKTESCPIGKWN